MRNIFKNIYNFIYIKHNLVFLKIVEGTSYTIFIFCVVKICFTVIFLVLKYFSINTFYDGLDIIFMIKMLVLLVISKLMIKYKETVKKALVHLFMLCKAHLTKIDNSPYSFKFWFIIIVVLITIIILSYLLIMQAPPVKSILGTELGKGTPDSIKNGHNRSEVKYIFYMIIFVIPIFAGWKIAKSMEAPLSHKIVLGLSVSLIGIVALLILRLVRNWLFL